MVTKKKRETNLFVKIQMNDIEIDFKSLKVKKIKENSIKQNFSHIYPIQK